VMRNVQKAIEGKDFSSFDDLNAFLATLSGSTCWMRGTMWSSRPRTKRRIWPMTPWRRRARHSRPISQCRSASVAVEAYFF
jgi:hypothetical protein